MNAAEIYSVSPDSINPLNRALAGAGVAVAAAGAGLIWYFNPSNVSFLPVCPLFKFTGFACPGCGMTRGFHALFHGDVLTALDYNALIPLFVLLFGAIFGSLLLVVIRGKGLSMKLVRPTMLWGILGLLIVFGVVRNLPYYPFSFLYP